MGTGIVIAVTLTLWLALLGVWMVLEDKAESKKEETRDKFIQDTMELLQRVTVDTARQVSHSVSSSVRVALEAAVRETMGEKGQAVEQATIPKEGDILHPDWMNWGEDEEPDAWGVGDSVNLGEREAEDRTAFLEEGQSIIPGVPLPDMSGEKYNG